MITTNQGQVISNVTLTYGTVWNGRGRFPEVRIQLDRDDGISKVMLLTSEDGVWALDGVGPEGVRAWLQTDYERVVGSA